MASMVGCGQPRFGWQSKQGRIWGNTLLRQPRHPEWVCLKSDAKSGFNAVHREVVFEAIEWDFPELWAWTDLCMGSKRILDRGWGALMTQWQAAPRQIMQNFTN
ncbi:hypothetical protein CYMTET_9666 [Cymbomonas tetramitiformis]|uniref:Reverse transcriptase n=1 Tax=Cymbomonas tetramitiformis TaxID=36881 RepID=A0AAE0LEM3_9CHLO|nr:hypothetical protein CYMTET_9666 [Cymbomonas tetramitiformis]